MRMILPLAIIAAVCVGLPCGGCGRNAAKSKRRTPLVFKISPQRVETVRGPLTGDVTYGHVAPTGYGKIEVEGVYDLIRRVVTTTGTRSDGEVVFTIVAEQSWDNDAWVVRLTSSSQIPFILEVDGQYEIAVKGGADTPSAGETFPPGDYELQISGSLDDPG